jgi:hypothetical protein
MQEPGCRPRTPGQHHADWYTRPNMEIAAPIIARRPSTSGTYGTRSFMVATLQP